MPKGFDNRVKLSPERAEACAKVTKELATLVHKDLCDILDEEVKDAYKQGGTSMVIPDGMMMPEESELEPLEEITLESHRKQSVTLLISFIIKNHTKPSEIEEICKGVMLSLGVHGKVLGIDSVVDDISEAFDI